MLSDAHIHLDALNDESTNELLGLSVGVLAVSCDPQGYARAKKMITSARTNDAAREEDLGGRLQHAALGLHPWCVPAENAPRERKEAFAKQLEAFAGLAGKERFIGEVGLDFWGDYSLTHDGQLIAFKRICAALSTCSHVLSLHSRAADRELLDCLEACDIVPGNGHTLILHGFNGPGDQMTRALKMGCLFSLGERELKTKRGCEYARQLPLERLLLETDMPRAQIVGAQAGHKLSVEEWQLSLARACELLASIKGLEKKEVERSVNNIFSSL